MKRWIFMALIPLLIYGLPFQRYETGKLLPILCVQAQRQEGKIRILSEAGKGEGDSWLSAVENLRQNASGEVFFDTAEQAVFSDVHLALEAANSGILRPGAEVFLLKGFRDPEKLYAYFSQHGSKIKIADLQHKGGAVFGKDGF